MNTEFKQFAKFLLLAQSASDAGKGCFNRLHNGKSNHGYDLKDSYISQAIGLAKKLKNVEVTRGDEDVNGWDMSIIYFDIKGYGQVSFHSFASFQKVKKIGIWDEKSSRDTCTKLNKKLGLQHYE